MAYFYLTEITMVTSAEHVRIQFRGSADESSCQSSYWPSTSLKKEIFLQDPNMDKQKLYLDWVYTQHSKYRM